jgi:hypothetical protein
MRPAISLVLQAMYICAVIISPVYIGNKYIYNYAGAVVLILVYLFSVLLCVTINFAINESQNITLRVLKGVSLTSVIAFLFYLVPVLQFNDFYSGSVAVIDHGRVTVTGLAYLIGISAVYGIVSIPAWWLPSLVSRRRS